MYICCTVILIIDLLNFLLLIWQCYFGDDKSRVTQALVTKCHNVCQPRFCCFDSYILEKSCKATVGEEECELFALCEQMITADGGVVKTLIELVLQEFDDENIHPSSSHEQIVA